MWRWDVIKHLVPVLTGGMFSKVRGGEIYRDHFRPGLYVCAKCGHELFSRSAGSS